MVTSMSPTSIVPSALPLPSSVAESVELTVGLSWVRDAQEGGFAKQNWARKLATFLKQLAGN